MAFFSKEEGAHFFVVLEVVLEVVSFLRVLNDANDVNDAIIQNPSSSSSSSSVANKPFVTMQRGFVEALQRVVRFSRSTFSFSFRLFYKNKEPLLKVFSSRIEE